jgi:hypothetical protein
MTRLPRVRAVPSEFAGLTLGRFSRCTGRITQLRFAVSHAETTSLARRSIRTRTGTEERAPTLMGYFGIERESRLAGSPHTLMVVRERQSFRRRMRARGRSTRMQQPQDVTQSAEQATSVRRGRWLALRARKARAALVGCSRKIRQNIFREPSARGCAVTEALKDPGVWSGKRNRERASKHVFEVRNRTPGRLRGSLSDRPLLGRRRCRRASVRPPTRIQRCRIPAVL